MALDRRSFLETATSLIATNFCSEAQAEATGKAEVPQSSTTPAQVTTAGQPLCCVLSPSGLKLDPSGRMLDFDNIARMVLPAVRAAGFEIILAQEPLSGEKASGQIFDRLLQCDHLVADISDRSPDISYEIGVRHAVRPTGTTIICAQGSARPFYNDITPVMTYRVSKAGTVIDSQESARELTEYLHQARIAPRDDSPLFSLLPDVPRLDIDHAKSDALRQRAAFSEAMQARLRAAVQEGKRAVLQLAQEPAFADLADVDSSLMFDLFISLRDVEAHPEMIALYRRMPLSLQRAARVREEYALALQRSDQRQEAIQTLKALLQEYPDSDVYGRLGRIYKDMWIAAKSAGLPGAAHSLREAISAYYEGFQVDWRDAYPGINAVTLMEMETIPDPRQAGLLPVVRYSAVQSVKEQPDYWDYATLLELAILARDPVDANKNLDAAVASSPKRWQLESTARNLRLIWEWRRERGENTDWVAEIEHKLMQASPRR
jgi:tetratricopeptide (TPR) repeat protein